MSENTSETGSKKLSKILLGYNEFGAILPLAVLLLVVAFVNSRFFRINNLFDILRTTSFSFIIAIPITFLMSAQGLDLSIGAVTSLGGVVCAFAIKAGIPLPLAIILGVLSGGFVGFLNAVNINIFKLPAFIETLGMQFVVNGFVAIITKNLAVSGFPDSFKVLAQYKVFGVVSMPVIYAIILGIIGHIMLSRTKMGREVQAIGGNTETAYLAGINVRNKTMGCYIAVGLFSAFSGVLMASRFASAQPAAGTGTELTIMAAVIIGGTSMFGGQGTVIGSVIGCLLLATITNALILMNVSALWTNFIYGIILILALGLDKYRRKLLSGE